jgi:alanine dehydrogenase
MLVLTRNEVEDLLDLDALQDALAAAHVELSGGRASLPPRIAATTDAGFLGAMPAYVPSSGLGCKLVSLFPGNVDRPTHQALIVLFDAANGSPVALLDGTYITAIRTAAAATLAARLLARDDARVLAIVGTGVQARAAARTFAGARSWDEIRLAGRDAAKTAALAEELGVTGLGIEQAVRGADVVHVATHSPDPVVRLEWLAPGAHVGSVGFNTAGSELDPAIVAGSRIVVESRPSTFAPPPAGSPDLAAVDPASVVELGELVLDASRGRQSPADRTLYKSVGVAAQDLAAGALVLAAARERGVGQEIELEEVPA